MIIFLSSFLEVPVLRERFPYSFKSASETPWIIIQSVMVIIQTLVLIMMHDNPIACFDDDDLIELTTPVDNNLSVTLSLT